MGDFSRFIHIQCTCHTRVCLPNGITYAALKGYDIFMRWWFNILEQYTGVNTGHTTKHGIHLEVQKYSPQLFKICLITHSYDATNV